MRLIKNWILNIQESDGDEFASVHSIHYSPDGNQLIVAADENIMVYNPHDGTLIKLLRGHKDKVHTVAYSKDGKKFASGGHDKTVIIWNSDLEGILKYGHNDSIQCLAYNPVTDQLASCSTSDFAFWSSDVKAVQKHKLGITGRISSCAWSPDGQHLALGVTTGFVSIRNKMGDEKVRINKNGNSVWTVHWVNNYLLVGDWSETISFYNASGQQIMKERSLGLLPTSISTLGDIILVAGAGGWAVLTSEGVPVYNEAAKWIWSIQGNISNNTICLGGQDGSLCCYTIVYNRVHGLYREKYVYRENMSDVIIHDLTSDAKVRIKCHDRVQKIAIHKGRLAVQLPERIVIYEQRLGEGMLFKVKEKIPLKAECSLLVITSDALLMCQDAKLEMISNINPIIWRVPASIRYVKVVFLHYKEVLLLGLSNGQIWKVNVNISNAEVFISIPCAIRCFDLSANKRCIAIVDENSVCHILNISTGQEVFTIDNISSLAYHISCENLLALSGGGRLSVKAGEFPEFTQPQSGSVVGFQGGKVFCLQTTSMQTISIPLAHSIYQFARNEHFKEAYEIAGLGINCTEWENLGFTALEKLSLNTARKAFQQSENILYLQLIDSLETVSGGKESLALAEICGYRGRYDQAAKIYVNEGMHQKALMLYTDLRIFNKAQEFLGTGDSISLVRKKAEWASHTNEPRIAAEMFLAAGDVKKAADIMAQNGWVDMLIETGRNIDKGAAESLKLIADALKSTGELEGAAEVYQRLGDQQAVIMMTVEAKNWDRAFHLVQMYPEYKELAYIPYAQLMAKENKFIEAQKAYYTGGEIESAERVLKILIKNAIIEERFSDAGYLYWLLATQCLELATSTDDQQKRKISLKSFYENEKLATIYHAFDYIHQSIYEHFSLYQPETLFNAAKVCLSLVETYSKPPAGISLFCIYLCLVRQGRALGANKLARQMLDKIHSLKISPRFQESVEVLTLVSWAGPYSDEGALSPLCYRCSHRLPLLATHCHHCQHAYVFSYLTFESLPLIEFKPEGDITTEEAVKLINTVPCDSIDDIVGNSNANVLEIDASADKEDPFSKKPYEEDDNGVVVCSRDDLLNLPSEAVIILLRPPPLPPLYYRNIMPDLHVHFCYNCNKLFYIDDLEMQMISKGHCAFCRTTLSGSKLGISQPTTSPKLSPRSPDHSSSM